MDKDPARRAHEVLMGAIDLNASERQAFVAAACAGDPELLRRVAGLLGALDGSSGFLETPALSAHRQGSDGGGGGSRARRDLPRFIGGYEIVALIGIGGMATVYEAIQQEPARRVALKVMRQGLVHTSAVGRFKYETEVLARIQHPGIVQIFEAGVWDDGHGVVTPFFAMEHIHDARTITAYAREERLPLPKLLALFATVCDAVQHGHQHGVIHRDLKPGNILVDPTGRPRVIDFGVARSNDPGQALITTGLGQLIGTLSYMSPEQCTGGDDLDIRTDVYSLGVILYELVCGRLPHDLGRVPVPEALRIVRDEIPAHPGAVDARLRGDLDAIVMMAIEKEPDRRYPTVAALAADIRRYLADDTIEARPPTMIHQCRRFVRRHRTMVAAAGLVLVAIVAAAVLSVYQAYQTTLESRRRRDAEVQAIKERDAARWQAYVANIGAAFSALQADEFQHLRTRLAAAGERYRGWEWGFLSRMAERSERTIEAHDDMIFGFAASPDGTRLATGGRDGSVHVWDPATGVRLAAPEGTPGSAVLGLAFGPDGHRLVSGSQNGTILVWDLRKITPTRRLGAWTAPVESVDFSRAGIIASADGVARLWDADSGELRLTLDDQPGGIHGVSFSSDGRRLLTWNRTGSVWLREGDGSDVRLRLGFGGRVEMAAFSADGEVIAAGGADGRVMIWRSTDGQIVHNLPTTPGVSTVRALALSPTGDRLAAGQIQRTIVIWSLADECVIDQLRGHEEAVSGLHFTADGGTLYSASWDRTIRAWSIAAGTTTGLIRTLAGHEDHIVGMAFSPDGSVLASAGNDRTIRLWDPELGTPLGALRGHRAEVYAVAFSPDGRWIASGSHDHTARLWDARTGRSEPPLEGHTGPIWSVAFSPDSRHLASAGDDASIRIWEVGSSAPGRTLGVHDLRIICIAFSPDGATLASASRDQTVRLWDVASGRVLHELVGHKADVFAVVFSPDGHRLYSGSRDQTVRVWDTRTGACLPPLGGHGQFVTGLSLSPDNSRLAAGSWFGDVLLWDVATLDLVGSFKAHTQAVRSVAFGPQGRWLASASYDQTVRLFDAASPADGRAARQKAEAGFAAAGAIADRLSLEHQDPGELAQAAGALSDLDPETRTWLRKVVLMRALAGDRP